MAQVAKMRCTEVKRVGSHRLVACEPDADGAREVTDVERERGPFWIRSATHVRQDPLTPLQEVYVMVPVYSDDPESENRRFAEASPSGSLTLTIENPDAMGYAENGREYRITIEAVRGPRKRQATPGNISIFTERGKGVHATHTGTFSVDPDGKLYIREHPDEAAVHTYEADAWLYVRDDETGNAAFGRDVQPEDWPPPPGRSENATGTT